MWWSFNPHIAICGPTRAHEADPRTTYYVVYEAVESVGISKGLWPPPQIGVKGSDTSVYVLLYMLDRGESEVTGSAAVCAAEYAADLV